jgi:hypothetical protein
VSCDSNFLKVFHFELLLRSRFVVFEMTAVKDPHGSKIFSDKSIFTCALLSPVLIRISWINVYLDLNGS